MSDPLGPTEEELQALADAALGPDPGPAPVGATPLSAMADPDSVLDRSLMDRLLMARAAGAGPATPQGVLSHRRRTAFLVALAETGLIGPSCARAGVAKSTVRRAQADDPAFAQAYEDAVEFYADSLESEATRRGRDGWREPVFFKGEHTGDIVRYSDRMLELSLKASRPERFRDRHDVKVGAVGGVLVVPGIPSEGAWSDAAASQQAAHRGPTPAEGG